jgi:hypothetical protein
MWAACSNRRIFAADLRKHSGAFHGKKKEDLVLRAKWMNHCASVETGG